MTLGRIQEAITKHLPGNAFQMALTAFFGIGAGLASVGFLVLTNHLFSFLYLGHLDDTPLHFALYSLVVITISSLIVGLMLSRICKEAAGSGIPQLKVAYWKDLGFIPWRNILVKFITGIISIGGGSSLGREGPSVYVGGGVGSQLAGLTGRPKQGRREAAMIGAAAALAAAFNTPLAAITFVLEELIGNLNSRFLGKVVLAAVFGAFTVHALVGRQPSFVLPAVKPSSWTIYLLVPVVAGVASALGIIFQRCALALRTRIRMDHMTPGWLKPLVGGLIAWVVGCVVFLGVHRIGVFGLGYQDLTEALNGSMAWKVALLLMGAKLVATIACYSWGGSGGIFAPTLFMGGLSGAAVAGVAGIWIPLSPADTTLLAAAGMSACFGAVVRAPLTALLIVFEMTHEFEMVPVLMLAMIVSQAMSRLGGKHNFYDALLLQDGHELIHIKPPADMAAWRNLPVSTIATFKPVVLDSLDPAAIREILDHCPYACFPVVLEGRLSGGLTRQEALIALKARRIPEIAVMTTCTQDELVHDVANKMVQSSLHMAVIVNPETGTVSGIVTLHDLLRAQASLSE